MGDPSPPAATEASPLLALSVDDAVPFDKPQPSPPTPSVTKGGCSYSLFEFLEAQTPLGRLYEGFTITLILLSMASFVLGTVYVPEYNPDDGGPFNAIPCGQLCDALWFGNDPDNGLAFLGLGTTSLLEVGVVGVFTIDYLLRIWTAGFLADGMYAGVWGRIRFIFFSFYSLVDLASTVPFYVDAFILINSDLASSQFLRMFRLFRMIKVEGRYNTALTMLDDVFREQRGVLGTALFVGSTVWMAAASLYYLVERDNSAMIYCGGVPDYICNEDDVDTDLCTTDDWGFVDCSAAGCPPVLPDYPEPCYNLFRSIPSALYFSLLNLFGEYPLIGQHSTMGKVVGTVVAVLAVAVFALPAGIIGNGFEDVLARYEGERTMKSNQRLRVKEEEELLARSDSATLQGRLYNFLFDLSEPGLADIFEKFVNLLVLGCACLFAVETTDWISSGSPLALWTGRFEYFSVVVFTLDYVLKLYAVGEDLRFAGVFGRFKYIVRLLPIVNLLSCAPFWIFGPSVAASMMVVKFLRLLRILSFERYTKAFTTFDDIIAATSDVLAMTAFVAIIMWVLFSSILYFTERDNPDAEMASYYNNVPNAMWMTLLNLSGESPLCHYSIAGKVVTGFIGLFASGLFGIPIGVLGAGFEALAEETAPDTPDEVVDRAPPGGDAFQKAVCDLVNGVGSASATFFELSIYALIAVTVAIGAIQTVEGWEDLFSLVEWFAIIVFTLEYILRVYSAAADPHYVKWGWFSGLGYVFSFYGLVDVAAIAPFYLATQFPGGWFDQHDEYLRMLRIVRLVKLDKYVPSISLLDDVFRLKKNSLIITGFAAGTLWVLFSALLYIVEHDDYDHSIDAVPSYGCFEDCTMADRFRTMFDSFIYTGIHLTGDYPVIEYSPWGRFINIFMVLTAVGVVSVPAGLIANGFSQIVESKAKSSKKRDAPSHPQSAPGDDWYEFRLAQLHRSNTPPPRSFSGPTMDALQTKTHEFLNGSTAEDGSTSRTAASKFGRFFMFSLIITNIFAVLYETIPEIDQWVGNEKGNYFDKFEVISVIFFTFEYLMRLFSASKNREALYSPWVYATTFFGIVDFVSVAPWFIEQAMFFNGYSIGGDEAKIFRIFRIFRILQLEDFITAFSKLDNVFRASQDVLKATGLMATIIWVGCGALFYIFEQSNPNWRECDGSIPSHNEDGNGCFDFATTASCNDFYGEDMCRQTAFINMPDSLYYTAVFLVGEWGLVDFTWPGRLVAMFLCVAGIGIYSIPTGAFFDSFGAILGLCEDEDEDEEEDA